jgi:hypothetical protein
VKVNVEASFHRKPHKNLDGEDPSLSCFDQKNSQKKKFFLSKFPGKSTFPHSSKCEEGRVKSSG